MVPPGITVSCQSGSRGADIGKEFGTQIRRDEHR
jgi:hypothetical protein